MLIGDIMPSQVNVLSRHFQSRMAEDLLQAKGIPPAAHVKHRKGMAQCVWREPDTMDIRLHAVSVDQLTYLIPFQCLAGSA